MTKITIPEARNNFGFSYFCKTDKSGQIHIFDAYDPFDVRSATSQNRAGETFYWMREIPSIKNKLHELYCRLFDKQKARTFTLKKTDYQVKF